MEGVNSFDNPSDPLVVDFFPSAEVVKDAVNEKKTKIVSSSNNNPLDKLAQGLEEYEFMKELKAFKIQEAKKFHSLAIFDFDQTLFRSPIPNPKLWDTAMLGLLMNEFFGWFEALGTLPVHLYNDNFIPSTLEKFESCIAEKTCMTVLLTGRKRNIFHERIQNILANRGLEPHMVVLNETYLSTFNFKELFIRKVIERFPSIQEINIFDDRRPHVKRFQTLLTNLQQRNGIVGKVHLVLAKPSYLPFETESKLVDEIMANRKQNPIAIKKMLGKYPVSFESFSTISFVGIFLDIDDTQHMLSKFTEHVEFPDEWIPVGDHVKLNRNVLNDATTQGWRLFQKIELEVIAYSLQPDMLVVQAKPNPPPELNQNDQELSIILAYSPAIACPKLIPVVNNWISCRNTPLNLKLCGTVDFQRLRSLRFIYPN